MAAAQGDITAPAHDAGAMEDALDTAEGLAADGAAAAATAVREALALQLVQAAAVGNASKIDECLRGGAEVDRVPLSSRKGWTALLCAADGGHLAATRLLLAAGASPAIACGAQRVLPLQRAALMAEAEVVAALLQARAGRGRVLAA